MAAPAPLTDGLTWLAQPVDKGPLAGVRVLDFSELLPGPFLTRNLVELGADVIKIERPPNGDNTRVLSPGLFNAFNHGKRGGLLDMKDSGQRQIAHDLARTADVLIESYRPGVMDRLGFSYARLQADNPGLIYASLSGYGANGPWRDLPGHDINYLAAAGIASLSYSPENGKSLNQGVPVADLAGATYALAAINAALLQRVRTQKGQYLDVSITDCMAHWMNARRAVFQYRQTDDLQEQRNQVSLKPAYGVFKCADGKRLTLAAIEQHFWDRLVAVLDLTEQAACWNSHQARFKRAEEINACIALTISRLTRDDLIKRLRDADVPAMEVFEPNEISRLDHFVQRELFDQSESELARFPVPMTRSESTS